MKVVLSWLREFCPVEADADELAEGLTAVGVKVEDVLRPWAGLEGVIIAKVLEVSDHPDSDKLCVTRVDTGAGEFTVCAGVRNMQAGDLVPYAAPGSRVPVIPEPLGIKKLRGVESAGMLCSPRELNVADVHTGIMVLPTDAPLGADFKAYAGLDDVVFDIEIEPNRPDLMSVIGVAREASALYRVPLTVPEVEIVERGEAASDRVRVQIDDATGCPVYLARVITGVSIGVAPIQAQARLSASGMRPISNVVDATNYVLLEMGHPLHPFDLALLADHAIVVRRAGDGEHIETLDGIDRTLREEDLVIADGAKPVAVAGVMGSAAAEVSDRTIDVVLEAALFDSTSVLRTARHLGLSTEASMRFERGVDPGTVRTAGDRAASLIALWSGGTILAGAVGEAREALRRTVVTRPSRASSVLGIGAVSAEDIVTRLARIDVPATTQGDDVVVEVPGWRRDIQREIDVIEEVVRLDRGYEQIEGTLPTVRGIGGMAPAYAFRRKAKDLLAGLGFREMRALSFASLADLELMGDPPERAIKIANPLAADEGHLRTRLTPGLLRALQRNRSRNVASVRIFESGVVFRAGDPVEEVHKIAFAMTGPATEDWHAPPRPVDVFDATGVLSAFLEGLGIDDVAFGEPVPMPFHPGRSATVLVGGVHAGVVGEIHPRICREFDLSDRVAIGVLASERLREAASRQVVVQDVPRFPPVHRDLAFIVDQGTPAELIQDAIHEVGADAIGAITLFDVFTGAPVPDGRISLAYALELRAHDRTLTDEETDEIVGAIAATLAQRFGADLRSA